MKKDNLDLFVCLVFFVLYREYKHNFSVNLWFGLQSLEHMNSALNK